MPNHDDAADYDSLPALKVLREPRGHPGCRYYGHSNVALRAIYQAALRTARRILHAAGGSDIELVDPTAALPARHPALDRKRG